jgi:hypothetical protein
VGSLWLLPPHAAGAVSPYLKSINLLAANKLVHLFQVFSSPRFIMAAEQNHRLVFFLLEVSSHSRPRSPPPLSGVCSSFSERFE